MKGSIWLTNMTSTCIGLTQLGPKTFLEAAVGAMSSAKPGLISQ
jgi:hypothetical protein